MRRAAVIALPLLLFVTACGGRSPVGPSNSSSSGATIRGSIVGSGSMSASAVGSRVNRVHAAGAGGTTVSVVGSNLSTTVDGSNQFSIGGVPPGPVKLRFSGSNVNADLDLAPVESTETIDLSLTLGTSSVSVTSERRSYGSELQLEGRVEALPSAGALMVAGQLVTTTATTRVYQNGVLAQLSDVQVGYRVHVKGQADAVSLVALVINIQNTYSEVPEDESDEDGQQQSASIEGTLMSISGADLLVGTTIVHTDTSTVVRRRGEVQDLTVLVAGMTLHVVGARQPDASINARMIQIKDDAVGAVAQVSGSMGGVKGSCVALQFSINGYPIVTDGSTIFTPACTSSAYKSGTKVTVSGVVQTDGSILASTVTK